ncbi:uncharacterized protein LOC126062905 isoform X3 [Elephas maximus indicus]|uniref:uncharacterized protein LOC126062905 isoform X3 n=1 Tax=Elephas maximus indicus TaxID=99487 RepID=UPI0021170DEC|nr:uncharacterized protein LOC126062905 isoform X3 [Elephas maximus indicus]
MPRPRPGRERKEKEGPRFPTRRAGRRPSGCPARPAAAQRLVAVSAAADRSFPRELLSPWPLLFCSSRPTWIRPLPSHSPLSPRRPPETQGAVSQAPADGAAAHLATPRTSEVLAESGGQQTVFHGSTNWTSYWDHHPQHHKYCLALHAYLGVQVFTGTQCTAPAPAPDPAPDSDPDPDPELYPVDPDPELYPVDPDSELFPVTHLIHLFTSPSSLQKISEMRG